MPDYVRIVHVLSPLVFFGVPGLVAGILLGRWRKSWTAVIALIAVGIALSIGGLASIPDDPDDNGVGPRARDRHPVQPRHLDHRPDRRNCISRRRR
jgi:hypothetical protein